MTAEPKKQIAFVLYPGLTPLDLIGPLQALSAVPRVDPSYEVMVVAETTEAVRSDSVISLAASHTFDDASAPYAIVVPGGGRPDAPRSWTQAARRLRH
jgi:transcriptional regulator GlxA family with amidase domain